MELAAYRIAQEALNNALQHAQAQHITVRVQCDDAGVTLAVVDDGVGFVLPERPDVLTQAGHFGLVGLWERVRQVGGTLQIHTLRGRHGGGGLSARTGGSIGTPLNGGGVGYAITRFKALKCSL